MSKDKSSKQSSGLGHRGSRKVTVSMSDLIIQGRGVYKKRPVLAGPPWTGSTGQFGSFDMAQAKRNAELGLI